MNITNVIKDSTDESAILLTYLHFHISLLLPKVFVFLFYVRFVFSAAHVWQSLLGAQLGDRGRCGHPIIDARHRLGQLQEKKREETFLLQRG